MIPILLVDDDIDMLDLMNLAFKENGSFDGDRMPGCTGRSGSIEKATYRSRHF